MAIILEFGKKMIFIYENYLKLLLVFKIRVKFAEFLKIKTHKVLRGDFGAYVVKIATAVIARICVSKFVAIQKFT